MRLAGTESHRTEVYNGSVIAGEGGKGGDKLLFPGSVEAAEGYRTCVRPPDEAFHHFYFP